MFDAFILIASMFLNPKVFNPTGGVRGGMMADNDQALPHTDADPSVSVGGGVRAANAARRQCQVTRRDRPVF